MTRPRKKSRRKRDSNPGPSALEADALPLGQRGGVTDDDGDDDDGDLTKRMTRTVMMTIVVWSIVFFCGT